MSWIEALNLPKSCLIQKRIPLKKLAEHCTFKQKQLIERVISSVALVALIDEETSRIRAYVDAYENYQAFFILEIASKQFPLSSELHGLLHGMFPNPTILYSIYENRIQLSSALKRINLNNAEQTIVEEVYISPSLTINEEFINYIGQINYQRVKVANLKEYYSKYSQIIQLSQIIEDMSQYPSINVDVELLQKLVKDIKNIQDSIKPNEEEYRKEKSLARRMDLHMQITKDKKQLEALQKQTMEVLCQS